MSYYLGCTACDGGLSGINFADDNIGRFLTRSLLRYLASRSAD